MARDCNKCTKCCEGWLTANIRNQKLMPGSPCNFVEIGEGCTIYEKRPEFPCRVFRCAWLEDETIPVWMAPKNSGAIIRMNKVDDIGFVELIATGQQLSEDVLSWFILWGLQKYGNIRWTNRHQVSHHYGSDDFIAAINKTT